MKRLILIPVFAILAVTSMVLAQSSNQATLRTPSGERPITIVQQGGQTYVSAHEMMEALGGTIESDNTGYKVSFNNAMAAFGPDSRFAVVRDDLIEMPVPPIVVEGRPFVPWQFFNGYLSRAASQEARWDEATRQLVVQPRLQAIVDAQVSVANVQGISKIVVTFSGPAEYGIVKQPGTYMVVFRTPIRPPFPEQSYDDPYVSKIAFEGNALRIQLTSPDVAGDTYRLENPFRIVLDLRKAAAPIPGALAPQPGGKPVDLPGIRTIVIDPGHGGKEVGAVGPGGLMEKDATLALCRRLSSALGSKLNARVVLTRDDDSLVSLDQRTAIANQYGADLFLSVHMNAAVVKGAHGSETYFLSLEATDEQARRAAEFENTASISSREASSDLKLILWDLAQQEYIQESSRFAQVVQEEMNAATSVQNRGVKQAPFKVLVGATMPAALVEVAFISNPEEEAKLQSEAFQTRVVEALTRAVERYKRDYEARIGIVQPKPPVTPAAASAGARGTGD
jgi:N-acetylmuramoyl-L-alanine amidase